MTNITFEAHSCAENGPVCPGRKHVPNDLESPHREEDKE